MRKLARAMCPPSAFFSHHMPRHAPVWTSCITAKPGATMPETIDTTAMNSQTAPNRRNMVRQS